MKVYPERLGKQMVVFALLSLLSCTPFPSSKEMQLSYKTETSAIPQQLQWKKIGIAHELINVREKIVVISGGDAPIPEDEWLSYTPPFPWKRNIERNLLFSETAFLHSPDMAADIKTVRKISGFTWIELAKPMAIDYIPEGEKTDILKPSPGHLVVKVIKKAQVLKWNGPYIYRLSDGKGNYYVMHAVEDTAGPNIHVPLPSGWSLEKIELKEPLMIAPFGSGDQAWYNIVGDCLGQGYHQYIYAAATYPN